MAAPPASHFVASAPLTSGRSRARQSATGAPQTCSTWFAAFAGTLKFCSVFAATASSTPCGNTATHLQVEAMVETMNNLTGGLGFQVTAT